MSEKIKEEVISEALQAEEKQKSYWYILDTDGKLWEFDEFDFKGHDNLRKFSGYEYEKDRSVTKASPHVKLMRSLELVDYEPASDPGNFRYYPKGRMVKALLEEYVTNMIHTYGGIEVETPLMYNMEHPSLKSYLNRFPARQYTIESDDNKYFMRFAACFGQFLMSHDATISYRNLPMKIYEMTRYSFRREQRGELTGLRRLRAFTMPDVHALCKDLDQAKDEYKIRFKLSQDVLEGIGLERSDYELAFRMVKDFWKENMDLVKDLAKSHGKPVLIEMWDERSFYYMIKWDMNFVDNLDKASALATDQIDVENGERYDIRYMDEDGVQKHPYILHCSPSGAIERDIYALLEKAAFDMKKGIKPSLPLWLAPSQVRIIPVSNEYVELADRIQDEFSRVRVDIDNRDETVGKKIREAEKEWVPYIIVVGEKEADVEKYGVRVRGQKKPDQLSVTELQERIHTETTGKPYRPVPLPIYLQDRPKFVG
ncbi:threonine--tRNA ligase [Candidatus Bathyarchaeota archaeon]|jgi:threonyl-tRNA synthetase|nr:threonine--tRNA ligase [Candidatus Bathyarchaeota archaeon]MBT4319584.1 threonine--tRNA ligase [Candidatus Bathyarchaeota archaeon]MBT4422800.1 threonine--tRNA ligase [Candidatus Bathyarchaeota archaeon]MBT6603453.1 threonine--tRNA ligase [Candidatus Bathyarchaeota archaeon]MBT7186943.1 threonine--tRNA ligase [Candidatus Bathyarchaeota archaeon]